MDKVVLAAKLESLRRCVGRIEQKRPCWSDLRAGEPDIQDIIVLNLTRAVQLCVDIGSHIVSDSELPAPQTMGEVFSMLEGLGAISPTTSLQLRKAVGFRNVAVHAYQAINWGMVYSICESNKGDRFIYPILTPPMSQAADQFPYGSVGAK